MWEDAREIVLYLPYEWRIHITQPWVCSVTASIIIGIAGIIPIFIIPSDEKSPLHPNQGEIFQVSSGCNKDDVILKDEISFIPF
jgi:hypothetical protein